jgi:hypothetical protein
MFQGYFPSLVVAFAALQIHLFAPKMLTFPYRLSYDANFVLSRFRTLFSFL